MGEGGLLVDPAEGAVQVDEGLAVGPLADRQHLAQEGVVGALVEHLDDAAIEARQGVLEDGRAGDEVRPAGQNLNEEIVQVGERLRAKGERPYMIPGGGSNPVGALGYVVCAQEIVSQANAIDLPIDCVVHATGSTGTQAGLVVGLEGQNAHIPVLGISVRMPRDKQEENVYRLAAQTWSLLGLRGELPRETVVANSDYVGAGYGRPTSSMVEAVTLLAQSEGILLDPVYSGKGMAGLIDLIRKGTFKKGQNVVFVHTGGAVALFGYRDAFGFANGLPHP